MIQIDYASLSGMGRGMRVATETSVVDPASAATIRAIVICCIGGAAFWGALVYFLF